MRQEFSSAAALADVAHSTRARPIYTSRLPAACRPRFT